MYDAWTHFVTGSPSDNQVVLNYSTNNGVSWSSFVDLSASLSPGSHAQGVNISTGPNGEVYAAFAIYDNWGTGVYGEDAIGFAKSTNGGVSFTKARIYSASNFGIRGTLKPTNIRVSSFPSMAVDRSGGPRNGYIYIVWPQRGVAPAGSDPDIVLIRSTNGGVTWSSPVRVNNDALNNGKDQYYPWCTVDQSNGALHIVFYDNRNTTSDSSGVWMATSFDGGITFENYQVSDANFKPKPISGLASGYQGDYIGIAAANGKVWPFWTDDRTGNYQGWIAEVTVGPPCPVDPASNPTPADGVTNIPINIAQLEWTNGTGATQCEVWFGEGSNLSQIYNGPIISSIAVPGPLQYNKSYGWRIVGKNDTCSVGGPFWSFRTELSPGTLFIEPFPDLANWTPVGPLGLTNWSVQSSNNATGQSAPELRLSWTPSFNGLSYLKSVNISAPNNTQLDLSLKHYLDWYANPSGVMGIAVTYDDGATYTPIWQLNNPTGNTGPETVTTSFSTPATDAANLKLALFFNGNSFNIDYWYIDDIELTYVIPVELTSFTAKAVNDNVELVWNTATESNNQGFEIQRSKGGEFEVVGYVPGFGTTTEHKSYTFTDKNVKVGKYTYRLKQIDYDGQYVFSNTVEVEVNPPLTFALEQNYPNPFNPSTLIKYSIAKDAMVNISVYNAIGEKVATLVNGLQQAGRYEVNFNAGILTSGIYFYSIEAGDFKSVKKMMLMK
ncbi:MAG: T9SS type A sorting domain-containing protein [Ignavibacterium sp.]